MFTYVVIIAAVLVISPFVLRLAASQKTETKQQLKNIWTLMLSTQILLGFLNWKSFGAAGLGLFLVISLIQLLMLLTNKYLKLVVLLNFINSILIFVAMIQISNKLGYQVVSFESIGSVFLVLLGNVVALAHINKDKNLLAKYHYFK